jgi:UDP-N-acetylmuramate dehydrogenase
MKCRTRTTTAPGLEQVLDLIERACDAGDRNEGAVMTLHVQAQVSLKPFNTFGIDVRARCSPRPTAMTMCARPWLTPPQRIAGAGDRWRQQPAADPDIRPGAAHGHRGIRVLATMASGWWSKPRRRALAPFVQWTLAQGLCGLENLSLIPGTVGAAPMQNIGAYGVEIKDVFAGLTAWIARPANCGFQPGGMQLRYRDSLFKQNRALVDPARALCPDRASHCIWITARCVSAWPSRASPKRRRVMSAGRSAVFAAKSCRTRRCSAMPAASSRTRWYPRRWRQSSGAYPDLVAYPQADGQMKLAAGWLIDGRLEGFREGDAGVHKLQALVLVNYGGATGHDIANLARRIQRDIAERFKVELEMEPNQY